MENNFIAAKQCFFFPFTEISATMCFSSKVLNFLTSSLRIHYFLNYKSLSKKVLDPPF